MAELEGRTAIVTGGGRGIGRGIVLSLAEAGADVAIFDVDLANAEATVKVVTERGRRALVARVDVTDPGSIEAGVTQTQSQLGPVDILVNNAGVVQHNVGAATSGDDFDLCYQVNLKGIWNVSSAVTPQFLERRAGKIVNIASIAGRHGGAGLAGYSASKAGAISLTQSLAATLGPSNINVNAVCPGLLWTDMWRKIEGLLRQDSSEEAINERAAFEQFLERRCPLRREQAPEDIGNAVVFLVSEAARNITGQALNVDGGIEMN